MSGSSHVTKVHRHLRTHGHKYAVGVVAMTTLKLIGMQSLFALLGLTTLLNSIGVSFADDVVIDTLDTSVLSGDAVPYTGDILPSDTSLSGDQLSGSDIDTVSGDRAVVSDVVHGSTTESTVVGDDSLSGPLSTLIGTVVDTLPQVDFLTVLETTGKSLFEDGLITINKTEDSVIATSSDEKLKVTFPDTVMVTIDESKLPYTESLILDTLSLSDSSLTGWVDSTDTIVSAMTFGSDSLGLTFSAPIQIAMDVNKPDGTTVDMTVVHDGGVVSNMLSDDVLSSCTDGQSSSPVSQFVVKNKKITFTTCGASIFVASTSTTISDPNVFVTTWKTDNDSLLNGGSTSITMPMVGGPYDVDWNSDGVFDELGLSGNVIHNFGSAGTYTVSVSGAKGFQFNPMLYKDARKLLSVDQWGTSVWTSLSSAFYGASSVHILAIDAPDLSVVTDLSSMFMNATFFDGSLSHWDVSHITNMSSMFRATSGFNQSLSGWDTSNVTDMSWMFAGSRGFNGDISSWNTSNVTDMNMMFYLATAFNQSLSGWNVSNVINMQGMFYLASSFNGNISDWDVSKVTNMNLLFYRTPFNQPLNNWNISSVTTMAAMFYQTPFNQPLNNWNTSNVTNMGSMFQGTTVFNQPLNNWNTSKVTNMNAMFSNALSFDQNIGGWNVSSVTNMGSMFYNAKLSTSNYDALLTGWDAQILSSNVSFHGGNSKYCLGSGARANMIASDGWTVTDGGVDCSAPVVTGTLYTGSLFVTGTSTLITNPNVFVTTWKTDTGAPGNTTVTLPMVGGPYDVDWNSDGVYDQFGLNNTVTHDFGAVGTYTVSVSGAKGFRFVNGASYAVKLLSVDQWGTSIWTSLDMAFYNATNMHMLAVDAPNLSAVTDLLGMFYNASSFNEDISHWDVSNITNMRSMFQYAASFNQSLSGWDTSNVANMNQMFDRALMFNQSLNGWDTSNVTSMSYMFYGATLFNQPLDSWNTSNVTSMYSMFTNAASFNSSLSGWNTSSVTDMSYMFYGATLFNQPLDSWNTSNVTSMYSMFTNAASFNSSLSGWNTSSVTDMSYMLYGASAFNQPLNSWNTSNVTNMSVMFGLTPFNQPLYSWNVSKVTDMSWMFYAATAFDQNIGSWDVSKVTTLDGLLYGAGLSTQNYDSLLTGWDAQILKSNVPLDGGSSNYCLGSGARAHMVASDGWTISDGGYDCTELIPVTPLVIPDMTSMTDHGISSIDDLTNDNTPDFVTTCSITGNMLTVYVDGIAHGTGVCMNSISTITTSVLTDGSHVVTYTESSLGGESLQSPGLSVMIDTNTPMPTVNSIGSDTTVSYLTTDTTPTLVGTGEIDAHLDIDINGILYTGTINTSGVYMVDVNPALSDGTYTSTLTATDKAGNVSPSRVVTFTIDTTPPLLVLNDANPLLISYGSLFTDPEARRTDLVDGSGSLVGLWIGTPINTTQPGAYTLSYSYTDAAGNSASLSRSVVVGNPQYGGGGLSDRLMQDICPTGDYSLTYYDGSCGVQPLVSTGTGTTSLTPKIQITKKAIDTNLQVTTTPTPQAKVIQFDDTQVYNTSISDGYCYNRKSSVSLVDSFDLNTTTEFKQAMTFLYAYDMTKVATIDAFDPFSNLTREQAADMFTNFAINVLCRKANTDLTISYTDMQSADSSLQKSILLAYQLGLMKGSPDGAFRPKDFITKAEVNAVIIRMILKSYLNEIGGLHWYDEYTRVSEKLGIVTQGAGETPVIRNDATLMLFRSYKDQKFDLRNIDYTSFVLNDRDQFIYTTLIQSTDPVILTGDSLSGDLSSGGVSNTTGDSILTGFSQ